MPNRTEAEIKLAHQELADFMYPRKIYGQCDECGGEKHHKVTCPRGKYQFQGWATNVKTSTITEGKCDAKDCPNDATMRIRLNIWGSLYEFDACRVHGMREDSTTHETVSRDGDWCDNL